MMEAKEPTHPHRAFFAARYITLGEAGWFQGRALASTEGPRQQAEGDGFLPRLGHTLQRCVGQGQAECSW